jgi:AcrR family transcriptional regulator
MDPPSRSRRPRREERREETREELVASAATVFAERGFHGASLEQIARDAGYSTGAIYWHFGGKDELFLAAFETYALTRVGEFAEIAEHASGGFPERTRAFADQWMARHASNPAFMVVSLEFLAHAWRKPHLLEAFAARNAAIRLALGRILGQEAQAAGVELPMPAQDLATVLRQLGVGLALAKLAEPEAFPDRLYGDFVELFSELAAGDERRGPREAIEGGRESE